MKSVLYFSITSIALLAGCVVKEEGYHRHHDRVYVEPAERVEIERPYHHHVEEKIEVR